MFWTLVISLAMATPECVLSPGGLFIPMLSVLCGPQSAVPYHRLPRIRCLYLPVSPNNLGVLKSFIISRSMFVVLGSYIFSLSMAW